ncbi:MAG TPA: hypothetical protein PL124_11755, partial [Candidatus Cloacimonadota bacterium]|nr:hypothetical protein [Candidatus Cloacimonadota bacterium]
VNPDWHGTGNIFGALQDYGLRLRTSYTPVSGDYIPATDYNKFQMFFGGLTKNNLGEVVVKNLEPYVPDPDKGKIANLAYYLGENTPEAKAVMYSANFTSALERVMAYAGGDPNTFIDMLKSSVSGNDKAFQELAGHYLSSPEMVSIRGGLNDFLNNEKTKTYISIWNATAPKRILLENLAIAASAEDHISIAQVLEMLKTQETSEQLFRWISENPNTENRIVRMVQARIDPNTPNLKASDRITIEGLQERMDKFINGDIVYHPDAMMAKLRNSLEDSIKDHLVDRYGLKTDGFVSRLASLNKAVQSTLLLGLSPSYFANNFVDGMVNLAYNGAYGLMSPGHVAKLWEDMGIPMPSRINEGFGPGSVVASIYNDLNPNDLLSQLHKVVGWGNNKLGIFTALSDKVEKLQGATATTVGFIQYMRGNWKEGVGFGKLPADLEASIRQAGGDPDKLYRLVEQAKTPDEIRDIFAKEILASTRSVRVVLADGTLVSRTQLETIARVHQAVETVGQEVYGDNNAELLSDLIVKTGLDDTIVDNIRQGSTEQEAINNAVTELREAVNNQVTNDIISRIQTDEALISTEGSRIAINILNEMKANYMSRHALLRTQEFTQTADVYELRNKKLFSQADTYYDTFVKNTQDEIRILGEDYIIRLATVLRTLDPDSAVHQPMINGLLTQKNIWDTFYKTKNDMQNEFRMTKHADYEADRDKLIADITRLELKARTDETTQQDIIDHGYLRMLGTNDETRAYVQNWLSKNREMTNTLIEKDRAFFESIAELRKTDPRAAAAAFVKYNIDTYTPYVAKMLEANEAAQAGYDDAAASAQRNREVDAQRGVATEQPVEPARPTEPIELTTRKAATEAQDTKLKRSLTIDEARQYLYDAETRVKIKAVEDALYDGIKRAFPGSSDAALRSSLDLFRMKADVWAVNNKTTPLDFWKPYTSIENAETMQPPDALAKMILENNSKYGPALNEKDTKVAIDQFLSEAVRARGAVAAAFMAETKRLFPGIKKEQYQFVDSYIDMMANAYAKKYNKTPDDYYKDVWASRELVNDDTKDPISRAMMKYNREGFGLVTFDQYGKALLRTTEIADIKTFLHENWNVMSRVMLDPEDIDYIADHYSKGTMTGADFTLNRAKLANGQSLDPEVAKLLNQMEEDLVNDC